MKGGTVVPVRGIANEDSEPFQGILVHIQLSGRSEVVELESDVVTPVLHHVPFPKPKTRFQNGAFSSSLTRLWASSASALAWFLSASKTAF